MAHWYYADRIGDDINVDTSEIFSYAPGHLDAYIKTVAENIEPHEERDVALSKLIPTQNTVNLMRVSEVNQDKIKPIKVWASPSGYKIIDGHHRCTKHILKGESTIPAKIYYPSDHTI